MTKNCSNCKLWKKVGSDENPQGGNWGKCQFPIPAYLNPSRQNVTHETHGDNCATHQTSGEISTTLEIKK